MFGERLKKLRKSRNFSQDKLAEELNKKYDKKISKSMISRWENGKNDIQMEMVHIIADYFNVNPVRLINPVITDNVATLPKNLVEEKTNENIQVPILGEIACGDPITAEENIEGYVKEPTWRIIKHRYISHSPEFTIIYSFLADKTLMTFDKLLKK